MDRETCGYRALGHYCTPGKVQFISRYKDENDYCIGGRRTTLSDAGKVWQGGNVPSNEDMTLLWLFLLDEYAAYLQWHAENRDRLTVPLSPFQHANLLPRVPTADFHPVTECRERVPIERAHVQCGLQARSAESGQGARIGSQ